MSALTEAVRESLEAPSGKDEAYENFPVGSWLLPPALRPHIKVFYAFARAIDDIADAPGLAADDKVARLEVFARTVRGQETNAAPAKALAMRQTLERTSIGERHCLDLISAFQQDAVQNRYRSWEDLIDYCDRSAAPVGRFLLDLHGGSRHGYGPSDALCNALQVINHLQDCQEDYRTLDRVYLPLDWVAQEGGRVEDLDRPRLTPALRRVLDRMLAATSALLLQARRLPAGLASRRLAMEAAAILQIAQTLTARLRRGDPLAERIALHKADYALCCMRGAARALF
jgi:squalene synthase HpnC